MHTPPVQRGDKLTGRDEKPLTRDQIECSEGWRWSSQWEVDVNGAVDEDGMILQYSSNIVCINTPVIYRLGVLC